jgi:membrane-associated phospholipid phosphatase
VRRFHPHPLLGALICLCALVATGVLALTVPAVQVRDQAALRGFVEIELNRPRLGPLADHIASLADPVPYLLIGLALAVVAYVRGRPRVAAAIVLLLVATGTTTQILKPLLAHPRPDDWAYGRISDASWPSGHATAAMTLALCAVMAAPQRLRPIVALVAAAFATAVSYAILMLAWHFPSDVLGGLLVAGTWTCLAVAAINALERRWPSPARAAEPPIRPLEPQVVGGAIAGVALVVAAVALTGPADVAGYAVDRPTFVAGAGAIAVLAGALAAGLARVIRS